MGAAEKAPEKDKGSDIKLLSKQDILSADDRATEVVHVEEWGGAVRVRALSAWDQSEYQQSLIQTEADQTGKIRAKYDSTGGDVLLASMAIVDEDNERMFTRDELRGRSNASIQKVVAVARRISGMDVTVEEAKGN